MFEDVMTRFSNLMHMAENVTKSCYITPPEIESTKFMHFMYRTKLSSLSRQSARDKTV